MTTCSSNLDFGSIRRRKTKSKNTVGSAKQDNNKNLEDLSQDTCDETIDVTNYDDAPNSPPEVCLNIFDLMNLHTESAEKENIKTSYGVPCADEFSAVTNMFESSHSSFRVTDTPATPLSDHNLPVSSYGKLESEDENSANKHPFDDGEKIKIPKRMNDLLDLGNILKKSLVISCEKLDLDEFCRKNHFVKRDPETVVLTPKHNEPKATSVVPNIIKLTSNCIDTRDEQSQIILPKVMPEPSENGISVVPFSKNNLIQKIEESSQGNNQCHSESPGTNLGIFTSTFRKNVSIGNSYITKNNDVNKPLKIILGSSSISAINLPNAKTLLPPSSISNHPQPSYIMPKTKPIIQKILMNTDQTVCNTSDKASVVVKRNTCSLGGITFSEKDLSTILPNTVFSQPVQDFSQMAAANACTSNISSAVKSPAIEIASCLTDSNEHKAHVTASTAPPKDKKIETAATDSSNRVGAMPPQMQTNENISQSVHVSGVTETDNTASKSYASPAAMEDGEDHNYDEIGDEEISTGFDIVKEMESIMLSAKPAKANRPSVAPLINDRIGGYANMIRTDKSPCRLSSVSQGRDIDKSIVCETDYGVEASRYNAELDFLLFGSSSQDFDLFEETPILSTEVRSSNSEKSSINGVSTLADADQCLSEDSNLCNSPVVQCNLNCDSATVVPSVSTDSSKHKKSPSSRTSAIQPTAKEHTNHRKVSSSKEIQNRSKKKCSVPQPNNIGAVVPLSVATDFSQDKKSSPSRASVPQPVAKASSSSIKTLSTKETGEQHLQSPSQLSVEVPTNPAVVSSSCSREGVDSDGTNSLSPKKITLKISRKVKNNETSFSIMGNPSDLESELKADQSHFPEKVTQTLASENDTKRLLSVERTYEKCSDAKNKSKDEKGMEESSRFSKHNTKSIKTKRSNHKCVSKLKLVDVDSLNDSILQSDFASRSSVTESEADAEKSCKMNAEEVQYGITQKTKQLNSHMHRFSERKNTFSSLSKHKQSNSLKFVKQQWKLRKKDAHKTRRALLASSKLALHIAKNKSRAASSKRDSPSPEKSVEPEVNVSIGEDHSDIEEDLNDKHNTEKELGGSEVVTENKKEDTTGAENKTSDLQEKDEKQIVENDTLMEIDGQTNLSSAENNVETVIAETFTNPKENSLERWPDTNPTDMLCETVNSKICSNDEESMPVDVENCTNCVDSEDGNSVSKEAANPSEGASSGDEASMPNRGDGVDAEDENIMQIKDADSGDEKSIVKAADSDEGADSGDEMFMPVEETHQSDSGDEDGNLSIEAPNCNDSAGKGDEKSIELEASSDITSSVLPDDVITDNISVVKDNSVEAGLSVENVKNASDVEDEGRDEGSENEAEVSSKKLVEKSGVVDNSEKEAKGDVDIENEEENNVDVEKEEKSDVDIENEEKDDTEIENEEKDIENEEKSEVDIENEEKSDVKDKSSQEYLVKEHESSVSVDELGDKSKSDIVQELSGESTDTPTEADVPDPKEAKKLVIKLKRGRPKKNKTVASEADDDSNKVVNKISGAIKEDLEKTSVSLIQEDARNTRRSSRGGAKANESATTGLKPVNSDTSAQCTSDAGGKNSDGENTPVTKESSKTIRKQKKDTVQKKRPSIASSESESNDTNRTVGKSSSGNSVMNSDAAVKSQVPVGSRSPKAGNMPVSDSPQKDSDSRISTATSGDDTSEKEASVNTVVTPGTRCNIKFRKDIMTKVRISVTNYKVPPSMKRITSSGRRFLEDKPSRLSSAGTEDEPSHSSSVGTKQDAPSDSDVESSGMKTPTRTPRRKILKRPFSPTEMMQPSSAEKAQPSSTEKAHPSSAGKAQPSSTEKAHPSSAGKAQPSSTGKAQPVKTPTSSKRAKTFCPEAVIKPFSLGWMREVVHRATAVKSGKAIDIYYFTPEGTKLRSMPEVAKYLSERKGSGLTIENFTFFKETIYRHPFEKERGARVKYADGTVESTPIPTSASKTEKQKSQTKSVESPASSKKSAESRRKSQTTDTKNKFQSAKVEVHLIDDIKKKSQVANLRNKSQTTEAKNKSETHTEVSDKKRRSQTAGVSEAPSSDKVVDNKKDEVESPKTFKRTARKTMKSATDQPTIESSGENKSTVQNSVAPSGDIDHDVQQLRVSNTSTEKRVRKTPVRFIDEKPATSVKRARVKYTESKKAAFRLPRPCTSRCLVALHEEPTLQCAVCLCMFHRQCVPEAKKSNTFICKPCTRSCADKNDGRTSPDYLSDASFADSVSLPSLQPEISLQLWPNPVSDRKGVFLDDTYLAQLPPPPPLQKAPERHIPNTISPVIESHPSAILTSFASISCSSDVSSSSTAPTMLNASSSSNASQIPFSSHPATQTCTNTCVSSSMAVVQPTCSVCVTETAALSSALQPPPPFTLPLQTTCATPQLQLNIPLQTTCATPQLQLNIQPKVTGVPPVPSLLRTTLSQRSPQVLDATARNVTSPVATAPILAPRYPAGCPQVVGRYPVTCTQGGSRYPVVLTSGNNSKAYAPNKVTYRVFVPPQSCIPVSDILRPLSTKRSHVGGMRPVFAIVKSGSEHRLMPSLSVSPSVSQSALSKPIPAVLNSTVSSTPVTDSQVTKTSAPKSESSTKATPAVASTSGSARSLRPRLPPPRKKLKLSSDSSDSDFDTDSLSEAWHSYDSSDSESKKKKGKKNKTSSKKDVSDKMEVNGEKEKKPSSASSRDNSVTSLQNRKESSATSSKAVSCCISATPLSSLHPSLNTFTRGYDCLNLIFKKLKISDLLRAAQVNRSWNCLTAQRFLWEKISFQGLTVTDWMRCAESMKKHGTRTLNLRGIQLDDTGDPWKDFTKNLDNLTGIEHMTFGQVPPSVLEAVADKLPLLQCLECYCLTTTYKRPDLWTTTCKLRFFNLRFLRKLRRLKIRSAGGLVSDLEPTEVKHLPELQHLSLTSLKGFPSSHFRFILHLPNLVSLELGDCCSWDNEIYEALGKLTKLRQLRLENGGGFDITLAASLCRMRKLEELELMKFKIPKNLGAALETLTELTKLSLWPDNSDEAAEVNYNAFRAASRVKSVLYFCWGIISPDDCIPLLPILKEHPEDEDFDEDEEEHLVEEVHYEDMFERLCAAMPDSKVEMKCISEDFLNEYCSIQR